MNSKTLYLLSIFCYSTAFAAPADLSANLNKFTASPRQTVALSVLDLTTGAQVAERSSRQLLKPASVLKLLTSAATLDQLGPDYRFSTQIFYDQNSAGHIGTLFIRGGADPSLTIENLWLIARKLRKLGVSSIDRVILDDSRFAAKLTRSGQRAYETGSSALSLSFNSVAFDVCPGSLKSPAIVSVDPWEAPIQVRGSIKTIAGRGGQFSIDELERENRSLVYEVSGTFGAARSCETFYRSIKDPNLFFGAVFRRFAADLGIKIKTDPVRGITPPAAKRLAQHQSKALSLILEDMNHFSTNFIAEQVLNALGEGEDGVFDRERGLERIRKFLTRLGVSKEEFSLFDGSGLSHDNRLSASALTTVVRLAALSSEFGVEFQKSLSVAGGNGTLRDRTFGPGVHVRAKTGTLDGVSSLAGILTARSGRRLVFAILQNGKLGKDDAAAIEEKIIGELFRSL